MLAIDDVAKSSTSEFKAWFLDDGTIAGTAAEVERDFKRLVEGAESLGLALNPEKCEMFFTKEDPENDKIYQRFQELAPGVKRMTKENLKLLGAPIFEEAGGDVFREKLQELKTMVGRLTQIQAHHALFLLRNCLAIPKLTYLLRCTPCFKLRDVMAEYDEQLRIGLESILNGKLEEEAWQQCTLGHLTGMTSVGEAMVHSG